MSPWWEKTRAHTLTSHEGGMGRRMSRHSETSCPVGHPRGFSTQGLHLPTATPDVTAHVLVTTAEKQITPKCSNIRQPRLIILWLSWKVLAWDLSCGCPQMLAGATIIGRLDGTGHSRWCMNVAWMWPTATWSCRNACMWPAWHEGLSILRLTWQVSFPENQKETWWPFVSQPRKS